jgi:peroxiredoxin
MAETPSTMLQLGTSAPDFKLPDPSGKLVSLNDFKDARALLVAFICNHCPYVKHIQKQFASLVKEYQARGVGVVAISSNDVLKGGFESVWIYILVRPSSCSS